jgi:hypothetical protein
MSSQASSSLSELPSSSLSELPSSSLSELPSSSLSELPSSLLSEFDYSDIFTSTPIMTPFDLYNWIYSIYSNPSS